MNEDLKCECMRSACSEDWISKTYSEYLMTCAENKLQLMNAVQDACYDDTIEAEVDDMSDILAGFIQAVNDSFIAGQDIKDGVYKSISKTSQEWKQRAETVALTYQVGQVSMSTWWRDNISAVESISDSVSELSVDSIIMHSSRLDNLTLAKTQEIMQELKYPSNMRLTMLDGYVPMSDTIQKVILNSVTSSEDEIELSAVGSQDVALPNVKTTLQGIWDEWKSQYASSICWAQGFLASTKENLSDRMTYYTSLVSTFFTDMQAKWATASQNVKSMLASITNGTKDFIQMASDQLGWTELVESNKDIASTDVGNFTGASPVSDVDLHTAKGVATVAVRTVVAAGAAIWQGIKKLGQKIWKKAKPYVMAVTSNPVDIEVINDKSPSFTCENWMMTWHDAVMYFEVADGFHSTIWNKVLEVKAKLEGKWLAYNTMFGEALFRMNKIENYEWGFGQKQDVKVTYDFQFKPRCLDIVQLASAGLIGRTDNLADHKYSFDADYLLKTAPYSDHDGMRDPTDALLSTFSKGEFYYQDVTAHEEQAYQGFLTGTAFFDTLMYASVLELCSSFDRTWEHDPRYPDDPDMWWWNRQIPFSCYDTSAVMNNDVHWCDGLAVDRERMNQFQHTFYVPSSSATSQKTSVTNRDFLEAVSGYSDHDNSIPNSERFRFIKERNSSVRDTYDIKDLTVGLTGSLLLIALIQAFDKIDNPLDYVFIPYSSDNYTWDEPRFHIKSDTQNRNITDMIFSAIVIVAAVVIAVIVCKAALSFLKKKKFAKLNAKKGRMDNAMWNYNGDDPYMKLGFKDTLKYSRYSRKLDKMAGSTSGLISSGSANEFLSSGIDSIKSMLKTNSEAMSDSSYQSQADENGLSKFDYLYYAVSKKQFG